MKDGLKEFVHSLDSVAKSLVFPLNWANVSAGWIDLGDLLWKHGNPEPRTVISGLLPTEQNIFFIKHVSLKRITFIKLFDM